MKKDLLKKIGAFAGIVALFLVLAYAFVPEVLSGKVLNQSDITGYRGMSHEASEWNKVHPEDPANWTGAMFSGMPTTSFQPSTKGDWTQPLYNFLLTGKRPATWLFISLLGAFLLMLSLGIDKILAIGGAIAVTFCSYNLQIIQVGHNTKMQAIAFLPWVMAAVIFTYKQAFKEGKGWKSWLPLTAMGAVLFAIALSLQIKASHQQITYYLAIMIFVYAIALLIWTIVKKRKFFGRFVAASALLLVLGLVGIGTNTIRLAPLYEYTEYTMRGGSELSDPNQKEISDKGLQLDYVTAWSYGWNELPNMLIPNFNGGSSSGSINPDKSAVVKLFKQSGQGNANEIAKALPFYWGPQPFTAGPMYMGAISVFLFILGLFLYKGKEKWWMLVATIIAIFLALGNHFMWFTKLFYDYAPMYNKFRTVSMALVILQFTLPMLGFLVLDKVLKQEYSSKEFMKKGGIAGAITAGFCLLCYCIPSIAGSFSAPSDAQMQDIVVDALKEDRRYLLRVDALVSALLVIATWILMRWTYSKPKDKKKVDNGSRRMWAGVAISLLVLVNMFAVGKRFLSSEDFITPRQYTSQFDKRPVDEAILQDTDPSYRVADLTVSMFNDSFSSYWHKNIGGYSPAKLQRYQDLIDRYIAPEMQSVVGALQKSSTIGEFENNLGDIPIVSALNCRYFIVGENAAPVVNTKAYGNAWFVDSCVDAATPDDEIAFIGKVDLHNTAVIGEDFASVRGAFGAAADSTLAAADTIYMTEYAPDELHYHYKASSERPVVFSEVYYPKGWHAWVEDNGTKEEEVELFRADWLFRGAVLPAGEHDIVMRFDPKVYSVGETVSRASSATLLVVLLLASGIAVLAGRKKEEQS